MTNTIAITLNKSGLRMLVDLLIFLSWGAALQNLRNVTSISLRWRHKVIRRSQSIRFHGLQYSGLFLGCQYAFSSVVPSSFSMSRTCYFTLFLTVRPSLVFDVCWHISSPRHPCTFLVSHLSKPIYKSTGSFPWFWWKVQTIQNPGQ